MSCSFSFVISSTSLFLIILGWFKCAHQLTSCSTYFENAEAKLKRRTNGIKNNFAFKSDTRFDQHKYDIIENGITSH